MFCMRKRYAKNKKLSFNMIQSNGMNLIFICGVWEIHTHKESDSESTQYGTEDVIESRRQKVESAVTIGTFVSQM
jgi:hypothetical protein